MGTHTDMLSLSFPAHLAELVTTGTTPPNDEEETTTGTTESTEEGEEEDDASTAGVILQLGIFILIPVAMYFLLIRPRRRLVREQQAVQSSIEVGDEVLLTSGVYGFITGFEEGTGVVWVEIDDDVQVRVTRAAISGKANVSAEPPAEDAEAVAEDRDDALADSDAPAAAETTATTTASKAPATRGGSKGRGPAKPGAAPTGGRPTLKGTSAKSAPPGPNDPPPPPPAGTTDPVAE